MARCFASLVAFVCAAFSLAPLVRAEGPRMLFGRAVNEPPELTEGELEARARGFQELLADQGLVLAGTQVVPRSALLPYVRDETRPVEAWDEPPHRTSIFLNFFGGELRNGTNASESEARCVAGSSVDYPGFRAGEQAALAIIQVFKDATAPFGIRILYEDFPPKHLPYSQVMMGGRPEVLGLPPGVLGLACNLDCGDVWWRDTTFAFTEASSSPNAVGTTALQEAAHAWGLDHIDGAEHIMYPISSPGAKVWADGCTPYNASTGMIGCQATHERFCEPGAQDDVAELTAFFGPNSVDSEAPTVKMLAPQDGQMYTQGDTLRVEVEVDDNFLGFGWRLMVPELKQSLPVYDGRTVWELPVPAMGEYTIRVEALDHDGNVGFAEARVYVDTVPGQTGGDSEDPGDSEGSESTAGEGEDEGCSCRGDVAIRTGSGSASAGLLGLLGALLIRRRRAL